MTSREAASHSDVLGHRIDAGQGRAAGIAGEAETRDKLVDVNHLRLLAQLGGSTTSLALRGGMAYLGEGPRIVAVDTADPGGFARRGASAPLPGIVRGLTWSGELLAVIYRDALANTGNDGLALFDVKDGNQPPRLVSLLPLPQGPLSLAAAGSRLYVTGHDAARGQTLAAHEVLLAIDAADPQQPRVASSLILREPGIISPAPVPLSVKTAGDTLWLLRTLRAGAADETEVTAYSSASAPDSSRLRIRAAGRHVAAAADAARGLVQLVTVDPSRGRVTLQTLEPQAATPLVGSLELVKQRGCGGPLALVGSRAAYADRCTRRLLLLDLADPTAARVTADLALDVAPGDMAWNGDRLLVTGGAMGGLLAVDAADPAQPRREAEMNGLGSVSRLALHQGSSAEALLYGSDPVAGLWTLDPAAVAASRFDADPSLVLRAPLLNLPSAGDLVIADGRLVVAGWSEGLRPFDLATPRAPRPLPPLSQGRVAETLATDGQRVYAGLGSAGLAALTFQPDGTLDKIAHLEQPLIWQVDAAGDRLIGQGLGAFFALDRTTLAPLRSWPAPPPDAFKVNRADSLALDGDTLHLAVAAYTYNTTLNSFSDRLMSLRLDTASGGTAAPAGQAAGTIGSRAGRVLAKDGLVMVAGDGQLTLLRETADGPLPLDSWASPGSGSDLVRWTRVCADEAGCIPDLLFLADGEAGLAVLALEPGAATTPTASADRTATPTASRPTEATARRLWLPRLERR